MKKVLPKARNLPKKTNAKPGKAVSAGSDIFYRQVLESISDYAVFTMNINGFVNSWNTGAERLLGYTESEILNKDACILFTVNDNKKNVPAKEMRVALKEGRATDNRFHRRKDGTEFWVNGLMFPMYNDKGNHQGFTKVMRDLTEAKRAQLELEEAKQYAQSIVETATQPLIVLNADLTINSANSAFYKTFNVSKTATKNMSIYHLGKGQWNIPKLRDLLENVLPNDETLNDFELTHEFPEIGKKTMLLNARKLHSPGNSTTLILLAIDDITNRKAIEEYKNAFIGIASHELKTPVANIKAFAGILQLEAKKISNNAITAPINRIAYLSDKLNGLLSNLLDVSAIQNGKLKLQKGKFSISQLLTDSIRDFAAINPEHKIKFTTKKDFIVNADRFRIGQVVTNLISNAIKYSPQATEILVQIKESKTHKQITVYIQDFGIGISAEDQKILFQKFSRVSGTFQKNIPGIGLGLNICFEIIKEHQGKLTVVSKTGEGSKFCFTLPY